VHAKAFGHPGCIGLEALREFRRTDPARFQSEVSEFSLIQTHELGGQPEIQDDLHARGWQAVPQRCEVGLSRHAAHQVRAHGYPLETEQGLEGNGECLDALLGMRPNDHCPHRYAA
jgi:hypothetical protein